MDQSEIISDTGRPYHLAGTALFACYILAAILTSVPLGSASPGIGSAEPPVLHSEAPAKEQEPLQVAALRSDMSAPDSSQLWRAETVSPPIAVDTAAPPAPVAAAVRKLARRKLAALMPGGPAELPPQDARQQFDDGERLPPEPLAAQCYAHPLDSQLRAELGDDRRAALLRQQAETSDVVMRLRSRGFELGAPVYLRIYKDSSTLEVWLKRDDRYALFTTYNICRWSGSFGPKLYEGDRQSPEGYYVVDDQLFNRRSWKWKTSFTLNYPNAYDKMHGRTGSLILVHGGCSSSGCFAMTDRVIEEVYELAQMARDHGQDAFHVSVYPFPMTHANLARFEGSPWYAFWQNLKEGYDLFEATRQPPQVRVCDNRYAFAAAGSGAQAPGFAAQCRSLVADVPGWQAAPRRRSHHFGAVARMHTAGARVSCNFRRPSCRKFAALSGHKKGRAQRSARRTAALKGAVAVGRRRK